MRYPSSEKVEIIRIVEQAHLPAKQVLDKLGIPRTTFYRWYDRFLRWGVEGLEDRPSAPTNVASELSDWLKQYKINQVHVAPSHPQTQGKIERWHQTLKNRILLDNYYFKEDLERQIAAFIQHYNHNRYHESLDNLTPADVYFSKGSAILLEGKGIKEGTIRQRRFNFLVTAAKIKPQAEPAIHSLKANISQAK